MKSCPKLSPFLLHTIHVNAVTKGKETNIVKKYISCTICKFYSTQALYVTKHGGQFPPCSSFQSFHPEHLSRASNYLCSITKGNSLLTTKMTVSAMHFIFFLFWETISARILESCWSIDTSSIIIILKRLGLFNSLKVVLTWCAAMRAIKVFTQLFGGLF